MINENVSIILRYFQPKKKVFQNIIAIIRKKKRKFENVETAIHK